MNQDLFILYKLATRSRPNRLAETLESIHNNSSNANYLVLVSIDEDDESMQKYIEDKELGLGYPHPNVVVVNGTSKNKIDAINRDVEKVTEKWGIKWDILVNISDDMLITSNRFDSVLRSAFTETTDLFLHLPDGYVNEALATMSIMGASYYKRFDYIYHASYKSVYCDNEATDVAKILDKYLYINEKIFVHNHPANVGRHLWDSGYERTETQEFHTQDCLNYHDRKSKNFPND